MVAGRSMNAFSVALRFAVLSPCKMRMVVVCVVRIVVRNAISRWFDLGFKHLYAGGIS